jgi:glucosamine 6-phosphate synthetase-like amidotransferase/phosphosugar isomerase protein
MCCIFGIGFFKDHKLDRKPAVVGIISAMLKNSSATDRRASGVAVLHRKGLGVLRRPVPGEELSKLPEYEEFMKKHLPIGKDADKGDVVTAVIGHARTPTQGSADNNYNNHPVVVDNIVGVHNGSVWDKEIYDNFAKVKEKRIAQVDTEAIFQLVKYFIKGEDKAIPAIQKMSQYMRGGYACGMLNARKIYNLYAFRNRMPIRILYYPKVDVVFFATREHIITNSLWAIEEYMGEPEEIDLLQDTGIAFNLWDRSMNKFRLRIPESEHALG